MKIPILRSFYNYEKILSLGDNYSKTEKYADRILENLLLDTKYEDKSSLLFVATTVGGLDRSEEEYLKAKKTGEIIPDLFLRHEAGKMTKFLAQKYKFKRFFTISSACSSGLNAIGLAKRAIEKGKTDFAAAVGTDALCELTQKGFASLILIDPSQNARPFDRNREGIKLGEGAGGLTLISPKIHKKAEFYIIGYGSTCDAYHATAPAPDGICAIQAINQAIKEAQISPDDIDWICSHGTGTVDNDLAEIKAYRAVFGEKIPPFMSFKGKIGHTLAASGAIEVALVLEAMKKEIVPISYRFDKIDESIGIAPNCKITNNRSKFVLKTSFGFSGNNSAIIIEKGN
jgi:3-oxoacyl-(acyl-carrier-protein) synthase